MNQRLHYIDWIRVLAFTILILFHCAVPFTRFNWEVKNDTSSVLIDSIVMWFHQWRLPLIFFIAGVGVRFSLKKRSILKFVGERFVRLFLPLAFAMFFITPIQVYFEWLQQGKISTGFAQFYPSVYNFVPYPDGALTWSHMWFVAYLFVFTILLLPLFSLSKFKFHNHLKSFGERLFSTPITQLFMAAPFIFYYFALYIKWPEQGSLVDDWFVFDSSITFYLFGFLFGNLQNFWQNCLKYRKAFLGLALVLAIGLFPFYFWDAALPKQQGSKLYAFAIFNGLHIWTIILAVIGYAMRYLNTSNKYLSYLNTAVYPFYIIHQALIVALGYYVVQWHWPIVSKMLVLTVLSMASMVLIYHFIIKRTMLTRVLFGMKWKKGGRKNPVP